VEELSPPPFFSGDQTDVFQFLIEFFAVTQTGSNRLPGFVRRSFDDSFLGQNTNKLQLFVFGLIGTSLVGFKADNHRALRGTRQGSSRWRDFQSTFSKEY
jgi:hypothetical protein